MECRQANRSTGAAVHARYSSGSGGPLFAAFKFELEIRVTCKQTDPVTTLCLLAIAGPEFAAAIFWRITETSQVLFSLAPK